MTVKEFATKLSPEARDLFSNGGTTVGREHKVLLAELEAAGLIDYEGTRPEQIGLKTVATAYNVILTKEGEALWHDLLRIRPREQVAPQEQSG